jgi:hypothetical protein
MDKKEVLNILISAAKQLDNKYRAIQENPDKKMDEKYLAYCQNMGLDELFNLLEQKGVFNEYK